MSRSFCKLARLLLVVAALTSFAGCVSSRAFLPTEHVTGFSPKGNHYAAEYSIVEEGQSLADVKVWSSGAVRDGSDDDPRTTVRIGFELSNHAQAPIRLDAKQLFLEEADKPEATAGRTAPAHVDGELQVPPGQTRQVEVSFELPPSVWPSDVPGFRVAWTLVGQRPHARKTPFLRAISPRRDPYYGPGWGWGWYYPYYGYPGFYGGWPYRYGWPVWRGPRIYRYYVPR